MKRRRASSVNPAAEGVYKPYSTEVSMRRNMDLIRAILLSLEEKGYYPINETPAIEGYSIKEVSFHCLLCCDAKLVSEDPPLNLDRRVYLTMAGHDFCDLARDDERWSLVKKYFDTCGGVRWEAWLQALVIIAEEEDDAKEKKLPRWKP